MKSLVVITASELRDAALHVLLTRPQFNGKCVGAVEFVFDPAEPSEERRIRAEVVLFDTDAAARRYMAGNVETTDETPAGEPDAVPAPDAGHDLPETLEGEKHGD